MYSLYTVFPYSLLSPSKLFRAAVSSVGLAFGMVDGPIPAARTCGIGVITCRDLCGE